MIEIENIKKEHPMKSINFTSSVLAVSGLVLSMAGCSQKRELDPRTKPELVRVVEVGSSSEADPAFTGVVSARVESDLGFRVPGKITKRFVDTGQFVHAGQLLMTIDRTDYIHAITARAETVTAAKAKAVKLPPMRPDIAPWSKAARFPLPSTIRSRPHPMRHKLTSLRPRPRNRLREMRTATHYFLRMRTAS